MNETKSKLISFAVLLALFLTAVAFASRYDRSENGLNKQTNSQQNTNSGKRKKGNSNTSNSMANSNTMNSNTAPNTNGTPN